MNAAEMLIRQHLDALADERAHRLASIAAEALIRSCGVHTDTDCYRIPHCQADQHTLECITHLVYHGQAISHDTDEGYLVVTLQTSHGPITNDGEPPSLIEPSL